VLAENVEIVLYVITLILSMFNLSAMRI